MNEVKDLFNVYINIVILCIGIYMALIQSKNLLQVDKLYKEGKIVRSIGYVYLIIGIIGCVLTQF